MKKRDKKLMEIIEDNYDRLFDPEVFYDAIIKRVIQMAPKSACPDWRLARWRIKDRNYDRGVEDYKNRLRGKS